jgi:hypothetical protein
VTGRIALWVILVAKVLGGWGLTWDIQWHVTIGRDTFWIPPHLMMYASVVISLVVSFGMLALDTRRARAGQPRGGTIRVVGITGSRGFHLAAWGMALVILAAPIDELWHRLFGIDVTLWSPPHLLGLFGSLVNTLGCLMIAAEVYPARARTRLVALLVGGALLYGGVRLILEPSWLVAYTRGGVAFHTFAMLGALLLPLALLPAARLLDRRWAPVAVVVVSLLIAFGGDRIARAGFAIVQPVSVIGEEIRKDPTSAIALNAQIREKNRGASSPLWLRLLLPLAAAAMLAAVDVRVRPGPACVVYGVALFVFYGWYVGTSAAFAPLVPSVAKSAAALAVTVVAGLLGAATGCRLADALEPHGGGVPAVHALTAASGR